MARNKYPEITHERILDMATKLFLEKGWEETTIQDIVDALGDVTRGAFYHHFKSKDDIIDAVTTRLFTQGDQKIMLDDKATGLEQFRSLLLAFLHDESQLEFVKTAPSVLQSPIFIGKQVKECISVSAPEIMKLIEKGNRDGSMNVKYPKQAAETFLLLSDLWMNPVLFPISKGEYLDKANHLKILFDNIGIPVIDENMLSQFEHFYDFVNSK